MTVLESILRVVADGETFHAVVHGGPNDTVSTESGPAKSVRKTLADIESEIVTWAQSYLTLCAAQVQLAAEKVALATSGAGAAASHAAEAAASNLLAQSAWTAALAANPALNPPVQMSAARLVANLTIPDGYNATSIGPLTTNGDVVVTGLGNSTWRVL